MRDSSAPRAAFINQVLTSRFSGEVARRFAFLNGEVGVLYTLGRDPVSGQLPGSTLPRHLSALPPAGGLP